MEATAALQKEWMKIGKALVPIFNQIGQFLRDVYFTLYPPPPQKKIEVWQENENI